MDTKDIASNWSRIRVWLSKSAPDVLSALRPGATDQAISDAEAVIGVQFPEAVRQSFRIHDGQRFDSPWLFYGREFLSLERVVDEWKVWKGLLDGGDFDGITSEPDEFIRDDWWSPAWIPITYDGSGNHDCLDLAPSALGASGQIIDFYHDSPDRTRVASGYDDWLASLASDMEAGALVMSEEYNAVMRKSDI